MSSRLEVSCINKRIHALARTCMYGSGSARVSVSTVRKHFSYAFWQTMQGSYSQLMEAVDLHCRSVRSYRFSFQPVGWNFNNAASYVSPTSCKFNHVRHCTEPESGRMDKQTTIATQRLQFCEYTSIKLPRHTWFVSKLLHNSFHLNFLVSKGNCADADRFSSPSLS